MSQTKIFNYLSNATYDTDKEEEIANNEDMETDSYYEFTWPNRVDRKIIPKSTDPIEYNDLVDYTS